MPRTRSALAFPASMKLVLARPLRQASHLRGPLLFCAILFSAFPVRLEAQSINLSYSPVPASFGVGASGFTVECWVKYASGPGPDPRFIRCRNTVEAGCGNASTAVWELFVCRTSAGCTSGAPLFGLQTGGARSEIQSSAGIADGAYHHLAGTYDGSSLKIYVDGTLQGTLSAPGITVDVTNGLLVIGNATQLNNQMNGEIDEVRIWSVARTQSEIQSGMAGEVGSSTPNLAGYWRLNGNGTDEIAARNLTPSSGVTFVTPGKFNGAALIGTEGTGPPLSASASGSPTSGPPPLTVQFTGSGSGGLPPYSYNWSFGDGGTSSQQNPSHQYANIGSYTATLTVTDSQSSTSSNTVAITVSNSLSHGAPIGGPLLMFGLVVSLGFAGSWVVRSKV